MLGVRRAHGVVRRPDPRIATVGAVGDHHLPVDSDWSDRRGGLRDGSQEVDPAPVLLPGPPFELPDQWLGPLRHPAQTGLYLAPVGERVHSFGPGAQFTGR